MTKIKNTKKGMAKKTLSMSLVVAMLATSNVPVWAADAFSDGTDITTFSSEEAPDVDDTNDDITESAQDLVPQQPTISVNEATNGNISAKAAGKMTVDTNWQVSPNSRACINVFVPQPGKTGSVSVGDKNEAVKANFDEAYSAIQDVAGTALKGTPVNWKQQDGKVINPADYIGKTIYVAVTEAPNNGVWAVKAVTSVTITADSAQDYCDVQNGGEVEWGDTLPSVTPSMKAGASLTAGAWYKNGQAVAADYKTTSADVGATFEYKGTLAGTNTSFDGSLVTAKTLTIKGKQTTDPAVVSRVSWTGFSEEIKNNGTLTCDYDGKAHQITINNFTTEKGEKISGEKFRYTYMRGSEKTTDFTSAGTITVIATVEQAGALAKDQTITATLNIKGIDISKDTAATLKVNPLVYNRAGKYLNFKDNENQDLTGDALANAVNEAGLVVEKNGKTLTYGTDKDYVVSATVVTENKAGKEVEVKIEGKNNYTGTVYKKLEITAADISKATVSDIIDQPYTGSQIKPVGGTDFDVTVNDETLTYNADSSKSDYTLEYSNNVNVGKEATVTITGRGNYTGSVTKKFEITSISLANLKSAIESDAEWKGTKDITEVKVKGSTITVTYNKVSNVAGYDVVLGTSSKNDNGELRPYRYGDHKILNINKNKVTVQFKNVPKKNWVVGMRSFTKDPDTNKKVFSRWSNLMPAKVK